MLQFLTNYNISYIFYVFLHLCEDKGKNKIIPEMLKRAKRGKRKYKNVGKHILLSQRESFVTVNIFESKILMNFDVFEVPESE